MVRADHDALPPVLEGIGTDRYTDWTWNVIEVDNAHCREIIDNVVDMAHFFYIHFAFPTNFRNVFEGDKATQFMESTGRPDMKSEGYGDEDLVLKSEATYYGPSYMINWLDTDYKGFLTKVILINCHVPTGPNSFNLQYGLCVEKPEGVDEKTSDYIGKKYAETFSVGFLQDVAIWQNKAPVQNPLLCEDDGPVYQLRRWYEQFYVDKADVSPGDGRAVRVRGGHHQGERELARGSGGEPGAQGGRGPRRRRQRSRDSRRLMAYIVPTRPETLEDRALYTESRLVEVACRDCQARVMVRKNSEHHTSIQWTQDAVADVCDVRRARRSRSTADRSTRAVRGSWRRSRMPCATACVPVGAGVDPIGLADE